MDLDNELRPTPKKDKGAAKTAELTPQQIEHIAQGWQVLSNQGNLSLLRTLQEMHKEFLEKKTPMDSVEQEPLENSELKNFLFSDIDSPFLKREDLKKYIEDAQQSVSIIDQTDTSGAKLYDYIPEEQQQEIEAQFERLSDTTNIKEALEKNINSLAPNVWEEHKKMKEELFGANVKESEALLLGPNTSEATREQLKDLLADQASQNIHEISELTCLEKCRVAMAAITANPKNKLKKEQEAEMFLGKDYTLLAAQVKHMENMLEKDWQAAVQGNLAEGKEPVINPTGGKDLICPEILSKMKSPSKNQIKILEDMYTNMAFRKKGVYDPENERDTKVSFLLGSMSLLEEGRRSNALEKMESLKQEMLQDREIPQEEEEPENTHNQNLKKLHRMKGAEEAIKKGFLTGVKGLLSKASPVIMGYTLRKSQAAYKEQHEAEYLDHLKKAHGTLDGPQ
jgi:hypothetical protein